MNPCCKEETKKHTKECEKYRKELEEKFRITFGDICWCDVTRRSCCKKEIKKVLERILEAGYGGGNFRRIIMQELKKVKKEELNERKNNTKRSPTI